MIPKQAKESFWSTVEDCLKSFHCYSTAKARKEAKSLRDKLEELPRGLSRNAIYHDEPFYIACDIAGNRLEMTEHRKEYARILVSHDFSDSFNPA